LVKRAASGAGSFLGGFFNNPGVVILGALAIALLFFQKDIRGAFGSLGQGISEGIGGLGNIDITLPEFNFPDIKFPDIQFPSFDISNIFPSQDQFPEAVLTPGGEVAVIPLGEPGAAINPADQPTNPTPVDFALSEGLPLPPLTPEEIALDPNLDPTKFLPPDLTPDLPPIATIPFAVVTPAEPEPISALNLGQEQPFAEAPLGALSLSAIIDMFDVSASKAADIKFISQQGGDPFASGGNIFGENPPAVSDPQFQGLTPEQIFMQLVGGNISNF